VRHSAEQKLKLSAGPQAARFKLPALAAGDYFADLWVLRQGQTLGWGSAALRVTSPRNIAAITLARESFSRRGPIEGTVRLQQPGADLTLQLAWRDNYGRLVAQQTLSATEEVPFRLRGETLSIIQTLSAELRSGDRVLDRKQVRFPVHDLYAPRDDVQFIMWTGFGNDYVSPVMAREWARWGIDTQYTHFSEWAPWGNLWHLPYATRFVDKKTDWYQAKRTREKGNLVRDPCLTDPKYRQSVDELLTGVAQRTAPYSTRDFTLGDENHFVAGNWDLCFSPTCNADFREFAKRDYGGDLAALNREYGTNYQSWEEVKPATLEEVRETGRYAAWVDHRRHMESVWAGIHDFSRSVIRRTVPEARVGYEGSDVYVGSFRANDYWKLDRAMDLNNVYYRDFNFSAVRDFAAPGTLLGGGWFGGYYGNRNEQHMRWFPWMLLFKGSNSFWVWMGYGSAGSVMAFDCSMYPFFRAACEEIGEMKAGIGKLLMHAQRGHDGIALLYSPSSVHMATLTKGFPKMQDTLNGAARLLHDLALECRILSYAELEQGKLTRDEFSALLLAGNQALSRREAQAILDFAQAGGTVIADLRPGVANQHGTAYERSPLDALFGVKQNPREFQPVLGAPTIKPSGSVSFAGALPEATADGSLATDGGRAAGTVDEAPAVIVNQYGKGRGILLNFSLAPYAVAAASKSKEDFAGWQETATTREFVSKLLTLAGVKPRAWVEPTLPRCDVARFRHGKLEYVGVIQALPRPGDQYTSREVEPPSPTAATVRFAQAAEVYDVRAHKDLGRSDRVKTRITPGRAQLYALLPYRATSLDVTAAPRSLPQGAELSYKLTLRADKQPGRHVFRVTVAGPDGQERNWYSRNALAENGECSGVLKLALNDPVGQWKLKAHDVATGVAGELAFQVTARPKGGR